MGNWGSTNHPSGCTGCAACRPQTPEQREAERRAAADRVTQKRGARIALRKAGFPDVKVR